MDKVVIGVCDDEKECIERLVSFIEQYSDKKGINIQIEAYSQSAKFIKSFQQNPNYDFVFLDIEMGGFNGIEAAKIVKQRDRTIPIVFVSNFDQYALQAFSVRAFHFLKKPANRKEVESVLDMLFEEIKQSNAEEYLIVKVQQEVLKLLCSDIIYFEKRRNKIGIIMKNGEVEIYDTIKNLVTQLNESKFTLIHQGYIVNMSAIKKIESKEVVLYDDRLLPLSRYKQKESKQKLLSFISGDLK